MIIFNYICLDERNYNIWPCCSQPMLSILCALQSGAGDPVNTLSRAEAKITKMMAVILGLYFCCYIPQMLTLIVIRALADPPQWLAMVERVSPVNNP